MRDNKKKYISNSLISQKVGINKCLKLKIISMNNNKFTNNKIIYFPLKIQREDLYKLV